MTDPSVQTPPRAATRLEGFASEEFLEELWRDLLAAPSLVGTSASARALRDSLPAAANSREPLFLAGEPGSGRRLLAAAVHRSGPRADRPFIAENLAAVPESLRESELFGAAGNPGLLAEAAGGTIYLAGIEHLPSRAQERLRALICGIAAGPGAPGRARVIAGSDTDLQEAVRRGRFSGELAEKLSTFVLEIPPLRERVEDIPQIADHLLRRRAAASGFPAPALSPEALAALKTHSWAGNVRELDEELALASAGRSLIRAEDLSPAVSRPGRAGEPGEDGSLRKAVGELEVELITRTLGDTNWNKSRAARLLGLSRLGLQKKIDRYQIDRRR